MCWYCQQIYSFMSGFGSLQIKQSDGDSYLEKHANYISLLHFFTIKASVSMCLLHNIENIYDHQCHNWRTLYQDIRQLLGLGQSSLSLDKWDTLEWQRAAAGGSATTGVWLQNMGFSSQMFSCRCDIGKDNNFDLSDDVCILPLNISKMLGSRKMNCTSIGEILSEWCNMQGRDRWKIKLFVEKTQSNDMSYSAVSNL